MKKIDFKQCIAWSLFGAAMALGMFSGGTLYAEELEPANVSEVVSQVWGDQEGAVMQVAELTEEERQTLLAEISRQLEELEQELFRISLALIKIELEQQALALEQELQQRLAQREVDASMPVPGASVPEMIVEEPAESLAAQDTQASLPPATTSSDVGGGGEEGILALEEEAGVAEEDEQEGFLAALGPLGNLGTPELSALGILAFLAAFILIRSVRTRKAHSGFVRSASPVALQVPSPQPSNQQPQSQQGTLQERKEDLKERVAWE